MPNNTMPNNTDATIADVPKGAIKYVNHIAYAALEATETESLDEIGDGIRYLLLRWAGRDDTYREGVTDALIALTGHSLPTLVEQGRQARYKESV